MTKTGEQASGIRFSYEYLKEATSLTWQSFDIKKIVITYGYDLLFYIVLILTFTVWGLTVRNLGNGIGSINLNNIVYSTQQEANQSLQILGSFLIRLILSIVIFFLFAILEFSLIKGKIWSKLQHRRLNIRAYFRLYLLNLILFVPIIALDLYILLGLRNIALFEISLLLTAHFSSIWLYYFVKTDSLKKTFKSIFWTGCRFHSFFVPGGIILAITFLLRLLVVPRLDMASNLIFIVLIGLPFFSWARNYYSQYMERFIWRKEDR